LKYRKSIILTIILLLGLIIIIIFKSKLLIPFINFTVLLLLSLYLWSAIKNRFGKLHKLVKLSFSILFWLPLFIVVTASIALLYSTLDDWPPFLRVYFVGGLFTYIVSLIFPILFLFIADIVRWIQMLFASNKKNIERKDQLSGKGISRKKFLVNTGLSLGGIALGTMGFGMLHGNYNFKIWNHQLHLRRVPKALQGLRIVQISDMHLGTWVSDKPLKEVVEYINGLKADLVFFTGDLVNSRTSEAFPFTETLAKIDAKHGVYASLGNHDYGHYHKWSSKEEEDKNWTDLLKFYDNIGWTLLRNENRKVEYNNSIIQIIGVENWSHNTRFPRLGDLDTATDTQDNFDLNLLLSHDPTHWEHKVKGFKTPMDITFSGHTHGFQFGIESELFRWSPAQFVYKHWAGIYKDDAGEKILNVNRGIGAIGFPGRVGIRPEITFIELV